LRDRTAASSYKCVRPATLTHRYGRC